MTEKQSGGQSSRVIKRRKLLVPCQDEGMPITVQPSPIGLATMLQQAKEELSKEMEANLKQLRQVLQETERIAHDMETVLKQAKGESDGGDGNREKGSRNGAGNGNNANADAGGEQKAGARGGEEEAANGPEGGKAGAAKEQRRKKAAPEDDDENEAETDPNDPAFHWGKDQDDNDEDWDPLENY